MDKQVNKRIPANIISLSERTNMLFWQLGDAATPITYTEFLDWYSTPIGYTFQETEGREVASKINEGGHITFIQTVPGDWYKLTEKFDRGTEGTHEIIMCMEKTEEPQPEPEKEQVSTLEFESIYAVLHTLAMQIGIEDKGFANKYEIVRAIYEKYADTPIKTSNIYELTQEIYTLAENDKIYPEVKTNKLTFDGNIWKFERIPDAGEYIAGDLYVNNSKIGTYNGFTCRNTLSGWEEAALAIESQSFGNQAVSIIKEDNGEWQLK